MNKLPSYQVRFPLWFDVIDKWQIHGSLGEALHKHAIEWLGENGLSAIQELPYHQVGTDVDFDTDTLEFIVTVYTPWR